MWPRRASSRQSVKPARRDTRSLIYEYICKHPGVHIRQIERELGVAPGDMAYHLRRLSGSGLVKTRRCGMRRFVFQSGLFGEKQEVMLGVLMMPTPREILLCILESPGITQKALALRLKLSPPTIWWHTDRLARLGVISRRRTGRTIVYSVIATPGEILEFVRHYQPSAWEKWADRLHDTAIILSANHSEETVG